MDPDELEEFAALGQDVMSEGIEIFFRKEDLRKMFAAIIAANVTAYALLKTPQFVRKVRLSMEIERLQKKREHKTKEQE